MSREVSQFYWLIVVKFQLNFEITACDSYGIRGKPKKLDFQIFKLRGIWEPNKYAVGQNTQVHHAE